jgi:hypothetical protein
MEENPDARAAYQSGRLQAWLREKGLDKVRINKVQEPPEQIINARLPCDQ